MKKFLALAILLFGASTVFSQSIAGSWNGVLDVGVAKLHIVFNIEEKDGAYSATMDSPDQGAKGIPVSRVTFGNQIVKIKADNLGMSYEGVLANDSIKGTFVQMGKVLPLILTKNEQEIRRPQNPVPPYPYRSEDVKFNNKKAGITLAGTLTLPGEGGNFPVAVLVTGSGAQNRDEELLNHKPFLVLSDYLTRKGIAVLRYDDRGTAESGGVYKTATIDDFASDAAAAIDYVKSRKEINPEKIGIIGHSEGGTIAFMLAGEKERGLGFIVSMAGMAIPGDSLLQMQRYLIGKASGASDDAIALNESLMASLCRIIDEHSADYIRQNMDRILDETLPESLRGNDLARAQSKDGIKQLLSPELQSLLKCNPAGALRKITCPVLSINGDKDLQVPADINLNRVKALVKGPVTAKKYAGLNHLFQHCSTGLPNEYVTIEETIAPEVLSDMAEWILTITK